MSTMPHHNSDPKSEFWIPVTSDPEANSIHNANVSVYRSEDKILNLKLMPGPIRKASTSETPRDVLNMETQFHTRTHISARP